MRDFRTSVSSNPSGRPAMRRRVDFSDKKTIDRHLDRLNTRGVSRRDFMQLVSAGAVAGLAADALGLPAVAVAAPSGKIAYMYFSSRLQYCLTVSKAVQDCTAALGVESV